MLDFVCTCPWRILPLIAISCFSKFTFSRTCQAWRQVPSYLFFSEDSKRKLSSAFSPFCKQGSLCLLPVVCGGHLNHSSALPSSSSFSLWAPSPSSIGKPSGFCALLVTYSTSRCDEFHAPALCDSLDPLRSALFVVVHLVLVLVHIILPPPVPLLPTNLATAPGIEASFCSCSQFPRSQALGKPATFAASVFH